MSTITSPSRSVKDVESTKLPDKKPPVADMRLETRLNIKDLESLQDAFMAEGDGYDNKLSLNREQFCEALSLILNKGGREEYGDLFDKVDVTKEGAVDWDKFASHMLLEFYEKDDRVKSTQVPQWKDLRSLPSPHKEIIQRVYFLKNTSRYIGISKEGCVSMWGQNLRLQRTLKTGTESCKARDLWVTDFVPLPNINKIALSFTSKEIAFYDLSSKLEFNCQYKVQNLEHTPLCLDYWSNPSNPNEALIVWGDVGGCVNCLFFKSANIALFERPPAPAGEKQEPCLNVQLQDIAKRKYKNTKYTKHKGHSEWVRHVRYSQHLECFISCATTWNNSMVIGWMEKHTPSNQQMKTDLPREIIRTSTFQISQGVNSFDYHEQLNLIATAGVNHHVCLWNPYVVSKPNGVLRGHMASVIQVQFNKARGQLISFSKDKVLRIWDVQLQVCMQRLAGMFPKGPEVTSTLYFDEIRSKLFITFNYQLTVLEMKPEIRDRIMSHEKPVIASLYNSTYNQVISGSQDGNITVWMVDTGQKVKQFTKAHGAAELTCLAQDPSETRLYTGSTDGTVKIWDFNGHCYHSLECGGGQPADIGSIIVLKRTVLVVGWTKCIIVFRTQNFKDFHVLPSDWKGGQDHTDDILAVAFQGPHSLATGAYDGEIVIWNTNSEQASRHLNERCKKQMVKSQTKTFMTSREPTVVSDGGFDSHSYKAERPRTRPKSRAASRISTGSNDEQNEYGFAISTLLYLQARKGHSASGCANLVSCGGNGWVRFWNTASTALVGEYIAHSQVGSIIMATDKDNHWLVTADVDGMVKVWDISEYCLRQADAPVKEAPRMHSQWQPHLDMINSLEICIRNERTLVLSCSSDCSVALWDIDGNHIGVFGQEQHWKIEPYVPKPIEEMIDTEEEEEENFEVEIDEDSQWEPDDQAVTEPAQFRVNTWQKTYLGKDYQELRVKKRERRQPQTIKDLPYLTWEKTGQPPAGPYAALQTSTLNDVPTMNKPDFMANPHKYFSERQEHADQPRLPALAQSLKAAFDEKTLFPKFLLEYEQKMKQFHQQNLNPGVARGRPLNQRGSISQMGMASILRSVGSPPKKASIPVKPAGKLKPLSLKSAASKDSD